MDNTSTSLISGSVNPNNESEIGTGTDITRYWVNTTTVYPPFSTSSFSSLSSSSSSSSSSSPQWARNETSLTTSSDVWTNTTVWEDRIASFYDDKLRPIIGMTIGVLGLPSIAILIGVTLTPKYRKYSYSLYLTVMSVYDFLLILSEACDGTLLIWEDKYVRDYVTWDVPCRIYEHLFYVTPTISMWLNVAVAVDRYIVIAFPFKKDAWCNRRNSWIVSGGLALIVHSVGILYIYYGKVMYFPDYGYFCNGDVILGDLDVYLTYIGGALVSVILIFIFTVLSVVELFKIKQRRLKMTSQQPQGSGGKDKTSRATVSLVGIGVSAFVTQMPYVTNEMVRLYARHNDKDLYQKLWFQPDTGYNTAVKIFEGLSFLINIQNFYILFTLNEHFRDDVMNMLCCGRRAATKGKGTPSRRAGGGSGIKHNAK